MKEKKFQKLAYNGEKVKTCSFIIIILHCLCIQANEVIFKTGDNYISLSKNKEKSWIVSKKCEVHKCDATNILATISLKSLSFNALLGGKNPGAAICHHLAGTSIVYLYDMQGNENTFCKFNDGSLISNSTLVKYAQKNDGL